MKRVVPIAAAACAIMLGGGWLLNQGGSNAPVSLPLAVSAEEVPAGEVQDMVQGSLDAPIEVIEYASYTCPHCATFHTTAYKELKKNYIDTGKVKFTYREVYFDKYGLWASMIARCGGPEKFFGITNLIYAGQKDWARANSEGEIVEGLRKIGRLAGIEDDALNTCLQDKDQVNALVGWFQENAEADNISGTPSFLINGEKYSNMSYTEFSAILDEKLGD